MTPISLRRAMTVLFGFRGWWWAWVVGWTVSSPGADAVRLSAAGTMRHYVRDPGVPAARLPAERFTLALGPIESVAGATCRWVSLHATKPDGRRFSVWTLTAGYPPPTLGEASKVVARYVVRVGDDPAQEFRHRVTGAAVLPTLGAWEGLWPRPDGVGSGPPEPGAPVRWLGHRYVPEDSREADATWSPPDAQRLDLLPDVLVGVPSNVRTREDSRRFDGSDYAMVRLNRDDYVEMIQAGMNCFRVDAEQAGWLRSEPVFVWGVGGAEVEYPECLYRSTYLGPSLFLDEPAVGTRDHVIRPRLAADPALRRELSPQRMLEAFRGHFHHAVEEGAPASFMKGMRARPDVDLGTMVVRQRNLFSWETMIASAAWQLTAEAEAGPAAIVFEPPGRFGTRRTLPELNMAHGCQLSPDDPRNLAGWIYGFLRGAARAAGKDWGVSIYGAVDRADAPWLLTHAYDLGGRYFFFWDNYQLACVPRAEYLALARHLQVHVRSHPFRDHDRLRTAAEVVVLLPPGYDLGHVLMGRGPLWGLGELNLERRNRHGIPYRRVMGNFMTEVEGCLRRGTAPDLLWDLDGLKLEGYREVVRVREDGRVEVMEKGRRRLLRGPRIPGRPAGVAPGLSVELVPDGARSRGAFMARARVVEGSAPVYYTTGTDANGVYPNARVLWEVYGPGEEDYRALLPGGANPPTTREGEATVVEVPFELDRPGRYRLRAATTDLVGRSTVVWKSFDVEAGEGPSSR